MLELELITAYCIPLSILLWLLPEGWRSRYLIIITIIYLGFRAPASLVVLGVSTLTSYWAFKLLPSSGVAVIFVLFQNLGYFLLYKLGIAQQIVAPLDRFLPLGLSYYAFRQIHYALELYKGKINEHKFEDYFAYLLFLPTILMGPIHRFQPFLRNTYRMRWNPQYFSEGLERIIYGYAKIFILSNFLLGKGLDQWAEKIMGSHQWLGTYLNTLEYTLSAYFMFAGFSDVAIGLSLLMGYRVMENFNYPFLAPNISEFWNRWHISLSSWVKDYVFVPITSITRKPILGIIMTMLVIGLWHEISLRYIVWGIFHGLGIAGWHLYKNQKWALWLNQFKAYNYLSIFFTFHFVMLSFVFIREKNWAAVLDTFKTLFILSNG